MPSQSLSTRSHTSIAGRPAPVHALQEPNSPLPSHRCVPHEHAPTPARVPGAALQRCIVPGIQGQFSSTCPSPSSSRPLSHCSAPPVLPVPPSEPPPPGLVPLPGSVPSPGSSGFSPMDGSSETPPSERPARLPPPESPDGSSAEQLAILSTPSAAVMNRANTVRCMTAPFRQALSKNDTEQVLHEVCNSTPTFLARTARKPFVVPPS